MQRRWMLLLPLLLAACGGPDTYAGREEFQPDPRYRREFKVEAAILCGAAERVLLGQGYVVARGESSLTGGKEFQVDDKVHAILQVHVACHPRPAGASLFVAATEERFDVKTTRSSTLIGLPVVAPVSVGTRSESDNQVKIRGETITEVGFYERFYRAVQRELGR